jgi:purine-binding chemotaxis protein CheW
MDFFEIRKKAKERAAKEAEKKDKHATAQPRKVERRQKSSAGKHKEVRAPARRTDNDPILTDDDVIVGALQAELQGGPEEAAIPVPPAAPRRAALRPLDADTRSALENELLGSDPADRHFGGPPSAPAPEEASPASHDPLAEFFYDPHEAAPGLAELDAGPVVAAAPEPRDEPTRDFLSFRLGDEEYAVSIEEVREIVKVPPITEVPRAPEHILGVITLRGEVIPVFDVRGRLGLPAVAPGRATRIVICEAGQGLCGIVVDAVSERVRLPPKAIEPPPHALGGAGSEFLAGIGRDGDRLFILLDLALLLARAPEKELA